MNKTKINKITTVNLFVLAGVALLITTACATAPVTVKKDTTLERQEEVRVPKAVFDTNFSRDQYTIIGMVTGEGTVTRRLVEEGTEPEPSFCEKLKEKREKEKVKNYWMYYNLVEGKKASLGDSHYSYYTYYVLDYDRKYGSWSDEGSINIDEIGDENIFFQERNIVKKMETIAARIALYNAINTDMHIDAILLPKYSFTYKMEDEIFGKEAILNRKIVSVTAKVYGKAIRIKTDEELMETYKAFPELLKKETD